jgi:AraC-like DNA-binding protein
MPLTQANLDFRRSFYERWGKENAVVLGEASSIEYIPFTQTLSIKQCWGGTENYLIGRRRLAVCDSHFLILNEGNTYGSYIDSHTPVISLGVFFRPGMAQEVNGEAGQSIETILDQHSIPVRRSCEFSEHLRPCQPSIDIFLSHIRDAVAAGETDEIWLEEQLQALLLAMRHAEPGFRGRGTALAKTSPSTHTELLTRLDCVTDYMLSCHTEPLTLDQLSHVARLSKFHLVRLFRQLNGVTPFGFLSRARTQTAHRLIVNSQLSIDEVVRESGFGTRFTMFRQLKKHYGQSGRA